MADVQSAQTGEDLLAAEDLPGRIARLATAARALSRELNTILAEDGLREDHWRVMHLLAQSHGLLMGEISQSLVLPPATTTRLVDELTDSSLVFRRPQPEDARKLAVYLSRMGQERYDRTVSLMNARSEHLRRLLRESAAG
ncbi:MarR family transcriptional regulator [Streptomyces sp. NPDC005921]|uniref:MarR family winged helix-turn-helix transcriptional regulator n=1 Tax=Streptomyces sp. NPDC005827 TaxID=3157070 RepID=UPI0033FAC3EF